MRIVRAGHQIALPIGQFAGHHRAVCEPAGADVQVIALFDKVGGVISIGHAAAIGAGLSGTVDWLRSEAFGRYEFMFQLAWQGDFAVTYGKRHAGGVGIAVFNVYRIAGGKIAENWTCEEQIGPRETWGNSGKS